MTEVADFAPHTSDVKTYNCIAEGTSSVQAMCTSLPSTDYPKLCSMACSICNFLGDYSDGPSPCCGSNCRILIMNAAYATSESALMPLGLSTT